MLLSDFEQGDWNEGRVTDPTRPPWTDKFKLAFAAQVLELWVRVDRGSQPAGARQANGPGPQDNANWNFGQVAQNLDKQNARLGAPRLGPLALQTQGTCSDEWRRRLRRAGEAAPPPVHLQVHHQEGEGQGREEEAEGHQRIPLKKEGSPCSATWGWRSPSPKHRMPPITMRS